MRDLISKRWRQHVRTGQLLDIAAGCGVLLLAALVATWVLYRVAALDCEHKQLAPQLSYCQWFKR